MESLTTDQWWQMFAEFKRDAFHLELRDSYGVQGESQRYKRWLAGHRETWQETADWFSDWTDQVREKVTAGASVRRLRVVTEPLSDYIRFEHHDTPHNLAAGEQVRWLPRHQLPAVDFPCGGRDYWLLDDRAVVFGRLDDDGRPTGKDLVTDQAIVGHAVQVRDLLWPVGIPHGEYRPAIAV